MQISLSSRSTFTVGFALIAMLVSHPLPSSAQSTKLLSDTQYHDPHGFFNITPPAGWTVKGYPDDPRGKVKFVPPGVRGVSLLIIGMATDMTSADDVVASTEQSEGRLKRKYRRFNPSADHQTINWFGQPTVRGHFVLPNRFRQESIELLVGKQYYSASYAAPTSTFAKYKEQAMLSMRSLDPFLREVSSSNARKHLVASKVRLANLNIQLGYSEVAQRAIQEGLEIDPDNEELLGLRKALGKK